MLESCGKFFLTKIHPLIFFFLLLTPIFLTVLILFFQHSHLQELEEDFMYALKKEQRAFERKRRFEELVARYSPKDPFFLDRSIESLSFLEKEQKEIRALLDHPALSKKEPLEKRLQFLTGEENRLAFLEEKIRTTAHVKETEERQRHPIQVDGEDLKKLLSLLEDLPIDNYCPPGKRPQFLIQDLSLKKRVGPLQTDLFEVEMQLIKREFIPLMTEKLVFAGVGFATNFSSSLAFCSRTKLLAPEQKICVASLSNSQFFNHSWYIQ